MKHVGDRIQAFVAGELAGDERQAIADHLADCPACNREAEEARRLWGLLGDAAVPGPLPASSGWPGIQARTFGRARGSLLYGGGLWSKTGIAATALAAGLALAILLPGGNTEDAVLASDGDVAWGSSFWLDEQADTAFSERWLAVAEEGGAS